MSISMDKLAKELKAQMTASDDRKPKPYDAQAEVLRVEDGIAWVHIPGGVQETPVRLTLNAKKGDIVNIHVANGSAWITGNGTNPPTDDTTANVAKVIAVAADDKSEEALLESSRAKDAADRAEVEAGRAYNAAETAWNYADSANTAATNAWNYADTAHDEAERATRYANNALSGLGTLESVIDTVNWFADHKKASTDTTVNPNKTYYIYDSSTGTLTAVTPEGTENPSEEGWYELSEAIADYVATRVAETDDGLYVVGQASGWKVLVSSGEGNYAAGIYLLDPQGGITQASTASGISFDNTKPFVIGNNNTYIQFDPSNGGSITIGGGSSVQIGSGKTLNDIITAVEYGVGSSPTSHSDITSWSTDTPTWTLGSYIWMRTTKGNQYTYTCIQGAKGETGDTGAAGEDAVLVYIHSSNGMAFKNDSVNTTLTVTIYYGDLTITTQSALINAFGQGSYLQWKARLYGESSYTTIPLNDPRLSDNGFTFILTPADVNVQAVFVVEVITPD